MGFVLIAAGAYVLIGILFALYFVTVGVGRIDPIAKEGTKGFRILIFPGAAALWPLLLGRILAGKEHPPIETNAHRRAAAQ